MPNNFSAAKELIDRYHNILLTTHERTDGDDLGSVLALAQHLASTGKRVSLVIKGGVPEQLRYLPFSEQVKETAEDYSQFDLLIISGCSKIERCGIAAIIALKIPILNVDHHPDNGNYGTVNVVQADKSSVAELVYDFFRFCAWPITPKVAACLLTGIFTDTGSFMHSNTRNLTLAAAADLMAHGAHVHTVAKHTYKGKSLASLRAWGRALENAYYDEGKQIIYSVITDQDLADLKAIPRDAFEGLVETLNKVPEAKFALFLKQDGGVIKGSMRSDPHKGIDVQRIAALLGGGGHRWASGFSVAGQLTKNADGTWQVV